LQISMKGKVGLIKFQWQFG